MKYVLMLMMVLGLMMVPTHAGQREEAILNGLLGFGSRVLAGEAAATPAGEAVPAPQGAATPPAAAAAPAAGSMAVQMPFVQAMVASIRQAVDGLITEYKEKYKEEGRAYAREVGNIVVERVVQDPEINSTITSLRTLCWFVVAYLTLVTLIMLGCLVYLKRANARLLAQVKTLCRNNPN